MTRPKLELSDAQWRERLTPDEFDVLRRAGTRRAFTGEYTDTTAEGVYECRACGADLFRRHREVRISLRLAVFFRPGTLGGGDLAARRFTRDHSHRGAVRELPQPPGSCVLRRGLPHPDRSALLHQFDCAAAESKFLALTNRVGKAPARSGRVGGSYVCSRTVRRHQAAAGTAPAMAGLNADLKAGRRARARCLQSLTAWAMVTVTGTHQRGRHDQDD